MSLLTIVGLLITGLLLIVMEIFIPGGVVGLIGGLLVFFAVVGTAMSFGLSAAMPLGIICSLGGLALFFVWAKYFPTSRMGARFNLTTTNRRSDGYTSQDLTLEQLVGQQGVAVCDLRPSGTIKIAGRRFDVVTEGGFLDSGTPVVVTQVASNRIVVRTLETSNAPEAEV